MECVADAVEQVRAALSHESMAAAHKIAQGAVNQFPESGDCHALLALTELWAGQVDSARKSIVRARGLESTVIVLSIGAEIALFAGEDSNGLILAEQARAIDPDHWTFLRQSVAYRKAGRLEESRIFTDRYVELFPADPAALGQKVTSFMVDGDRDAAEAFLDRTPESYKTTSNYYRSRGSIAIQRKELCKAEEWFRLAIAANSDNSLAWAQLAALLSHTSRLGEAEQAANYSLELNSRSPVAYQALATVARKRGDRAKAEEYKRRAEAAVPGIPKQAGFKAATEALRHGNRKKQIELLSQPDKDESPMHRTMRLRALVDALRETDQFDCMGPIIAELESIDRPSSELAKAKSALQVHQGEVEEALATLDAGIAIFPTAIDLMSKRVLLLLKLGRNDDAASTAASIPKFPLESGAAAGYAVMDLMDSGFPAEAEALLTRAEREAPNENLRMLRMALRAEDNPRAAMEAFRALPRQERIKIVLRTFRVFFRALPKLFLALTRRRRKR